MWRQNTYNRLVGIHRLSLSLTRTNTHTHTHTQTCAHKTWNYATFLLPVLSFQDEVWYIYHQRTMTQPQHYQLVCTVLYMNVERCSPSNRYQNSTRNSMLQVRPSPHVAVVGSGHDSLHDWSGCVPAAGAQRLSDRAWQQPPVNHTAHTIAGLRGTCTITIFIIVHITLVFPFIKWKSWRYAWELDAG